MRLIKINTIKTPIKNFTNDIIITKKTYTYTTNNIIFYRKRIKIFIRPIKVYYFTNITNTTQKIKVKYKFA
jgi:hypothetical protein